MEFTSCLRKYNELVEQRLAYVIAPSSNMLLASGFCPVEELRLAGAPVGLGVDGSSSNDSSNLMQELRQAYLLQRLRLGADQFSHIDALELATKEGARLLNRDDIGEIRVGACADLAFFSTDELRFAGAHDPLATASSLRRASSGSGHG